MVTGFLLVDGDGNMPCPERLDRIALVDRVGSSVWSRSALHQSRWPTARIPVGYLHFNRFSVVKHLRPTDCRYKDIALVGC